MITNRNVFVIRQQRVVGPEQLSNVGGVKDRGVEIGVVADDGWEKHFDFGLPPEMTRSGFPIGIGGILAQGRMNPTAQGTARAGSQRHQRVERVRCARSGREFDTLGGEQTLTLHPAKIQNAIADSYSYTWLAACATLAKNAERQILNGKISVRDIGRLNPTLHRRIVSLVEDGFHKRRRDRKSSMGSVKEHEPNEIAKSWRTAAISRALSRSSRQLTPSSSKWNACGDCSSSN